MRILLINIALRPGAKVIYLPIGFAYIATAIKRHGYDITIMDMDAGNLSEENLEQYLRKNKYDVVCMGCIVTGYKYVKRLARLARQANPGVKVIVGNSVASSIPDILLAKTEADIAVIGEGDITITEILDALHSDKGLKGIDGICYKEKGKIVKAAPRRAIEKIDTIPFPEWDMFDMEKYIESCSRYAVSDPLPMPRNKVRALAISTARGCPAKCTFCYHVFKDVKYRYISPGVLVREIRRLKEKYGINYLIFNDDLTFVSKAHAREMAQCMSAEGMGIYWVASCRSDLFKDDSDVELARELKAAGCVGLAYSLESASREILEMMNKNIRPEDFSRQSRILDKAGLSKWTSLVFGYPIETKETIKKTIDCCIENGIYPSAGYLSVQPSTQIFDYAVKNGFIKDEEEYLLKMGDRQDLFLNLTRMSDEELVGAVVEGLDLCNKSLNVELDKASLLKTIYYRAPKPKRA